MFKVIKYTPNNKVEWDSFITTAKNATFLSVRGPRTRKRLVELGYNVPEKYGDPALLLPNYFPNVFFKKYELGIIPHFVDFEEVNNVYKNISGIRVIDLITDSIEETTKEILECKNIVSSSLHGIIVGQAYQIPTLWVKFSDKLSGDNVKFYDYFDTVGLNYTNELFIDPLKTGHQELLKLFIEYQNRAFADVKLLELRKSQLLESCPFF